MDISERDQSAACEARPVHTVLAGFRKACAALKVWLDEMPTTMPPTDSAHRRSR